MTVLWTVPSEMYENKNESCIEMYETTNIKDVNPHGDA